MTKKRRSRRGLSANVTLMIKTIIIIILIVINMFQFADVVSKYEQRIQANNMNISHENHFIVILIELININIYIHMSRDTRSG